MNSPLGYAPAWPAPANVSAFVTFRHGGCSAPPYDSNNLGAHVGDEPGAVRGNRESLRAYLDIHEPHWLDQVHGHRIVELHSGARLPEADGSTTVEQGQVCVVLTADCLPVLLCDRKGQRVAAVHCGWRGLARGILQQALNRFSCPADSILAYLGPAIGPSRYEVGAEVRDALRLAVGGEGFSRPVVGKPGHFLVDLYAVARMQLEAAGVHSIYGGKHCTFSESDRFFSYRRDGVTGRMASLIWINRPA